MSMMMRNFKLVGSVIALLAIGAASFAADIVGKWTGSVVIDFDKETLAKMKGKMPSTPSLLLELRADKTYKGTQTGGPDKQQHVAEGTYTFDGTTLKLMPKKRDGKPATGDGAKPRVYTLSKDGKTMTMDLSSQAKVAQKSAGGAAATITPLKVKMVLRRAK